MNLFMSMKLFNSELADVNIDSVRAIVDLRANDTQGRVINFISDIADVTITGNYKVADAISLLTNESGVLAAVYNDKLQKLFPSSFQVKDTIQNKGGLTAIVLEKLDSPLNIDYEIELKDFNVISAFIGEHLEIDARIGGKIVSDNNGIHLNFGTDVNYIKLWTSNEAFFVTNMNLNLDVVNGYNVASTSDVEVDLDAKADRIFTGKDINDFHFDMKMKNDKADISFGAKQDPIFAQVHVFADISKDMVDVSIDSLKFSSDQFLVLNNGVQSFTYTEDRIDVNKIDLKHNNAHVKANGFLSRSGNQTLNIDLSGLKGKDLSVDLLHMRPDNSINANINMAINVLGNMKEPVINMNMSVDSVKYGGRTFGVLKSKANYKNKNLDINVAFLDSLLNPTSPALSITGNIPVDL